MNRRHHPMEIDKNSVRQKKNICFNHIRNCIEFFCENCSILFCVECKPLHRGHHYFQISLIGTKIKQDLSQKLSELETFSTALSGQITELQQIEKDLLRTESLEKACLVDIGRSLNKLVNEEIAKASGRGISVKRGIEDMRDDIILRQKLNFKAKAELDQKLKEVEELLQKKEFWELLKRRRECKDEPKIVWEGQERRSQLKQSLIKYKKANVKIQILDSLEMLLSLLHKTQRTRSVAQEDGFERREVRHAGVNTSTGLTIDAASQWEDKSDGQTSGKQIQQNDIRDEQKMSEEIKLSESDIEDKGFIVIDRKSIEKIGSSDTMNFDEKGTQIELKMIEETTQILLPTEDKTTEIDKEDLVHTQENDSQTPLIETEEKEISKECEYLEEETQYDLQEPEKSSEISQEIFLPTETSVQTEKFEEEKISVENNSTQIELCTAEIETQSEIEKDWKEIQVEIEQIDEEQRDFADIRIQTEEEDRIELNNKETQAGEEKVCFEQEIETEATELMTRKTQTNTEEDEKVGETIDEETETERKTYKETTTETDKKELINQEMETEENNKIILEEKEYHSIDTETEKIEQKTAHIGTEEKEYKCSCTETENPILLEKQTETQPPPSSEKNTNTDPPSLAHTHTETPPLPTTLSSSTQSDLPSQLSQSSQTHHQQEEDKAQQLQELPQPPNTSILNKNQYKYIEFPQNKTLHYISTVMKTIFMFNITDKSFTKIKFPDIKFPSGCDSILIRNRVFICGGANPILKKYTNNYEYSLESEEIGLKADLINGRKWHALCVCGGNGFYALGGHDGETRIASVESYSSVRDAWKNRPALNVPRSHLSVCFFQNQFIYVFGGFEQSYIANVEVFDTFQKENPCFVKVSFQNEEALCRCGLGSVQINFHQIMLFGGDDGKRKKDAFIYDVTQNTLQQIADIPAEDGFNERKPVFYMGKEIWVIGQKNDMYIYEMPKQTWHVISKKEWKK